MKKLLLSKRWTLIALIISISLLTVLHADAQFREMHHHYFHNSQGEYYAYGGMSDGASAEDATWELIKIFYHIKDSDGVIHTLHVFQYERLKDDNGVWHNFNHWFVGYDEVRLFFDTHTSDPNE